MRIKGVSENEENIIKNILQSYCGKYNFYYYGSRVKGNFRALSDLDILVEGNDIDLNDIEDMKTAFDESLLPYVVNLSYNVDENFYNLIKDSLVVVIP